MQSFLAALQLALTITISLVLGGLSIILSAYITYWLFTFACPTKEPIDDVSWASVLGGFLDGILLLCMQLDVEKIGWPFTGWQWAQTCLAAPIGIAIVGAAVAGVYLVFKKALASARQRTSGGRVETR